MATIIYSRTALLGIINLMYVPRIDYKTWKTLRECGIANLTRRGCRAGARKQRPITSVTGFGRYNFSLNLQPGREMDSIMLSSKLHAITKINELRRSHGGLFMNNYNLISIKCHPSPATFNRAKSLEFAVLNTRSIRNKLLKILSLIVTWTF